MIAGGLKILLMTICALTIQTNKRNVVFQNEERSCLCNAHSLWLVRLHGNILLPQSHRGLRRCVRGPFISFVLFTFSLGCKSSVKKTSTLTTRLSHLFSITAPPSSTYVVFNESS